MPTVKICLSFSNAAVVLQETRARNRDPVAVQQISRKELRRVLDQLDKTHGVNALAALLRRCSRLKAEEEGRRVHAQLDRAGYGEDTYLGNLLVQMYGQCGCLEDAVSAFERLREPNVFSWNIMLATYAQNGHVHEAKEMFDKMPQGNVVSWNGMIAAYAQNGHGGEALKLFKIMGLEGIRANEITFLCALDACVSIVALSDGKVIHATITETGFQADVKVSNALVNMYGKCRCLSDAKRTFDEMNERNVVSWTSMITAYAQSGQGKEALEFFQRICMEGIKPDEITFISVLDACGSQGDLANGRVIHSYLALSGFEAHIVESALISMYSKCGSLQEARSIFNRLSQKVIGAWNAMITVYSQSQHKEEAFKLFSLMDLEGNQPDEVTVISVIDASTSLEQLAIIQSSIAGNGLESSVKVGNCFISKYGEVGSLQYAWNVFNRMPHRDVVSWNSLIAACIKNGQDKLALELLQRMDLEGVQPSKVTFVSSLDACANLSALTEGRVIHEHVSGTGLQSDVKVATALVNMYSRCGNLDHAWSLFSVMPDRNIISWSAMVAAYAHSGHNKEALQLFRMMVLEGVELDKVSFVNGLYACSHAGLLEDAQCFFANMEQDFGVTQSLDLFVCMVDIFGRVGRVKEAEELINNMPFEPDPSAWTTLLGSCRIHADVHRAGLAAENASVLDSQDPSVYVLLSNIYSNQAAEV